MPLPFSLPAVSLSLNAWQRVFFISQRLAHSSKLFLEAFFYSVYTHET